MGNVVTIRGAVARAKADGLPVSEYTLRGWIRTGLIPVRHAGCKTLLFYPNLVRYLQCEDGGNIIPATQRAGSTKGLQKPAPGLWR